MRDRNKELTASQTGSDGDAEAIRCLEQAIAGGKHWYIALLEAIGLWTSAEETLNGHTYRYLMDGEAFDWLLLAERLCETVDDLLPQDEKNGLLFQGRPPLDLSPGEVRGLIGNSKYRQYLNYFYGITVEGTLHLAVQDEVHKERYLLSSNNKQEINGEVYQRIYGATKAELLQRFQREKGYAQRRSITLNELKEFTYWLFKYRITECEKAKVASDTKKALSYLRRQWVDKGFFGTLTTGDIG
jgi:hypothetical protein